MVNSVEFLTIGQTVLPDRLVLKGQKLVENDKIEKLKCDILGDFQALWWCMVVLSVLTSSG